VREVERSAPSVEEAVEAALAELGASEQEVDVEIVQEPKGGFLGVGGQEAVVRVRLTAAATPDLTDEDLEDQAEVGAEFLEGLLERLGIEADVVPAVHDGTMYLDVLGVEHAGAEEGPRDQAEQEQEEGAQDEEEDDMGLLIGRHGQTLDALQELTRMVVALRTGQRPRIIVDVEDYRKRQRARLAARAREVARRVVRTGREEMLEPMNAFERKVVHDAVTSVQGAESLSRGEDPDRRVVVRRRS
jgi:spoIIIJ-associated protein